MLTYSLYPTNNSFENSTLLPPVRFSGDFKSPRLICFDIIVSQNEDKKFYLEQIEHLLGSVRPVKSDIPITK